MKIRDAIKWAVLLYLFTMISLVCRLNEQNGTGTESKLENLIMRNKSFQLRSVDQAQKSVQEKTAGVQFKRFGPGENGEEVFLTGINISFPGLSERNKKHGFNTFISDMISLHRKLHDMRNIQCKTRVYPDNLPPISVVVIFRDEWWSILLRTVYSILEMSPSELIFEVIVVDDGSTDKELLTKVKLHIQNLDKIKFIRNEVSRGLMMARQTGINAVKSDLFIVMDGHMEVGPGWLEPLIHRLVQQPKSLLCSHIGGIDRETFEYVIAQNRPEDKLFDQTFPFFDHVVFEQMFATYKEEFRTQRNKSVEPIPYGTIQGMMMVMRKDFFQQLGGFDPGMEVWGSEQIELSIKVWMCGGVVEMVPCSTVAHMYRRTPWSSIKDKNDFISRNKARMIQVWMDPPFNENINHFLSDKNYTLGNLTSRHRIRELNRCKPYQYFIDKVKSFSDVYIPTNVQYRGSIKNELFLSCVDVAKEKTNTVLILYPCHKRVSQNQYFIYTGMKQIRGMSDTLVDVKWNNDEFTVALRHSSSVYSSPTTTWTYDGRRLIHTKTKMCLTALTVGSLGLKPCINSLSQSWKWENAKKELEMDAVSGI